MNAVDVGERDPERAPVPWERPSVAGPGAGFTTGSPWLPIVEDAEHLAVAAQEGNPRSALSLFRRLIELRRASPALRVGGQTMLDAGDEMLAWLREADGERWLAAINMSLHGQATTMSLRDQATTGGGELVVSTDPGRGIGRMEGDELTLGVDEGVLVRLGPEEADE